MSDIEKLQQAAAEVIASKVFEQPPGASVPRGVAGTPGMNTKIFTGTLNANQSAVNTVYTLPGWRSSVLHVTILAADVNSDTFSLYFSADYAWYRQWGHAPTMQLLKTHYNWGQGSIYTAATQASGDNIQVRLTQGSFATNTYYQIITQYMLNVA